MFTKLSIRLDTYPDSIPTDHGKTWEEEVKFLREQVNALRKEHYEALRAIKEHFDGLNAKGVLGITQATLKNCTIDDSVIGGTTPAAISATTVTASGQITSTLATGTAPLVIASTTVVGNLNVSQLLGGTWAIPGTIGSTTANTGKFTTLEATTSATLGATPASWQGGNTGLFATVTGANSSVGSGGNLRVLSNTTQAVNVGGSMVFGGYYNGTTLSVDFAGIAGRKENSTAGNTAGYAAIGTRTNGGNLVDHVFVSSLGDLGVGAPAANYASVTTFSVGKTGTAGNFELLDNGAWAAGFYTYSGNAELASVGGTITLDSSGHTTFSGAAKSSSPSGGIGYATGAGGAVAQGSGSGKATGVTVNAACGSITADNAALAAGAKVSFVVTNSSCAITDVVAVSCGTAGGTANAYRADVTNVAAGSFTVTLENITAGSLSENVNILFAIVKAVTS